MVSIAEFQNNAYEVSVAVGTSKPVEMVNGNHHRVRKANYFSHQQTAGRFQGIKGIQIIDGNDTVYLPYYQSKIASVQMPTAGPDFFVTDNLSGCAIYIGTRPGGELVVFHANSQLGSSQAQMSGKLPSHQSIPAVQELDRLAREGRANHNNPGLGAVTIVRVLSKAEYLANVDQLTTNGDNFLGGTTVAGWRTGTSWEFWYQNWGSVSGAVSRLLRARQFYP
jgi:hypothetical protein